jgi:hypothetical protein
MSPLRIKKNATDIAMRTPCCRIRIATDAAIDVAISHLSDTSPSRLIPRTAKAVATTMTDAKWGSVMNE